MLKYFFILLLFKKREGIHNVGQILVKPHLEKNTCICIKKGMWDCLTKCTDSCNFLNGLNGWFKMQRRGGLPAIFLAMSNFSFFFSFLSYSPLKMGGFRKKVLTQPWLQSSALRAAAIIVQAVFSASLPLCFTFLQPIPFLTFRKFGIIASPRRVCSRRRSEVGRVAWTC